MSHNLGLSSATFSGGALTGGYGATGDGVLPTNGPLTVRARVRLTGDGSGSLYCALGADSSIILGVNFSANLHASYNSPAGNIQLDPAISLADAEHYVELDFDGSGGRLYCDGTLVASNSAVLSGYGTNLGVRAYYNGGNLFPGSVRDVALYNVARSAGSTCTVPSLLTGSETGLIAAWPLSADGNDITGQAPPTPTASAYFFRGAQG